MDENLKKRILSFVWRLGAYVIVAAITFTVENLSKLDVNPSIVAVIGLVAGEVTKYLNSKYQLGKAVLGAFKRSE